MSVEEAISSVERLFRCDISPTQVAAILFEPIQGEGGFNIAPPEFVSALRTLCDEHGILLIADEVQTGFARTGKLFAMEYYPDTKVDVITMAKSLGAVCQFPRSRVGPTLWMPRCRGVWAVLMPVTHWRWLRHWRCSILLLKRSYASAP